MTTSCVLLFLFSIINFGFCQKQVTSTLVDSSAGNQEYACGTVPSDGLELLISGGTSARRGEVPWHAGVYIKQKPYQQICGGSLISHNIIVSAAHCFWDRSKNQKQPIDYFAVAVGKIYRPWNNSMDKSQRSDVKEVHMPFSFQGSWSNYQDDIAIVIITTRFNYNTFVRPVCVDFDDLFERRQLQSGRNGTVAGWGLTAENGKASQVLKIIELPVVGRETCYSEASTIYNAFITQDKICAGYLNDGIALCKGDSGGGLAFPKLDKGKTQYYLRGIVSSAPSSNSGVPCNVNFYTTFTRLQNHQHFISRFWPQIESCILPPYPTHGTYVANKPNAKPGDAFESVSINVTCSPGHGTQEYGVDSSSFVDCNNGWWPDNIPKCVPQCRLTPDPSVDYRCLDFGSEISSRACNEYEPSGTFVSPQCRSPHYYTVAPQTTMRCINGTWDYVAKCIPERGCGTVIPQGMPLVAWGVNAKRGEVPWHAGVYKKDETPHRLLCSGSLVSNIVIISVAHCFWNSINKSIEPANKFAVAVGKIYSPWDNVIDDAQRSDVKDIFVPDRFQAIAASFQEDLAIVIAEKPFKFNRFIQPICVNFNPTLEHRQLQPGNLGKFAGWGFTTSYGYRPEELQVVELPYVSVKSCLTAAAENFRPFITSDKFCAGYTNGTSVCKLVSGGGLAFSELSNGIERFYLRGILSTGQSNGDGECDINAYGAFTQLQKHEQFVNEYLKT